MPVLCHCPDLVTSVVVLLFLSHPDFAVHVFSFLLSPTLWSPPLECVSYSGTASIRFDRNTVLANLLFFFLMLHCFLLFLQNNSIILSFPFLVINFSHGLPPDRVSTTSYLVIYEKHMHTQIFIQYNYLFLIIVFFGQMISFLKYMNKWLIKEVVRECTISALC